MAMAVAVATTQILVASNVHATMDGRVKLATCQKIEALLVRN